MNAPLRGRALLTVLLSLIALTIGYDAHVKDVAAATSAVPGRWPAFADLGDAQALSPVAQTASGPIWGVNFMSSAEDPADAQQYVNGLATGATWNRWPMYWFNIEQSPGAYDWSAVDTVVTADLAQGLHINAILLGTPGFYLTGDPPPESAETLQTGGPLSLLAPQTATPQGLYDSVFSDGSDVPAPGKNLNPANKWAQFVAAAVARYRPGGVMATAQGWPAGTGITHWEMWNEPDLSIFWDGTVADYARLLKVGYLAAKHTDPEAQVLFAGLANNFASFDLLNYYNNVMAIYDADPLAAGNAYFHDILATHSYYYAWQTWYHVFRAGNTLRARGLDKPIWLNETGVPAWNDYPGPVWDPNSNLRATMSEQADYVIQTAFYGLYAGADALFHFQLYDGCGNQPRFTDFPPHNGELCDASGMLITDPTKPCAGDANGLYRNPVDAACFTQHPQPETARPNLAAFRLLATTMQDVVPLWRTRPGGDDPTSGPQEWIAFYQPASGLRLIGMWARYGEAEVAMLPASAASALLISADGSEQTITPQAGFYQLTLPGATNQNNDWGDPNLYPIGGRPFILVEEDTRPPEASLQTFRLGARVDLAWSADDHLGTGIVGYDLYVAEGAGPAEQLMQQTTETSTTYVGDPAKTYTFTLVASDRAGNASNPAARIVPPFLFEDAFFLPVFRHD